ncbi:hypothetical protein [Patiriisocius sp. Uisw_017]|jgi:hypothetical protein|uniref:hypothetical protein n=1 Tax=Patiriisocius sp. Uisw_017 TaxID=3230968 RepID=UPI0039E7FEAC
MNFKFILSLLLVALAGFKLTTSIMNPEEAVSLFGGEINVWLYRFIWLVAGLVSVYNIYRENNKLKK